MRPHLHLVLAQKVMPVESALQLSNDQARMDIDAVSKPEHFLLGEVRLHAGNEVLQFGGGYAEVDSRGVRSTLSLR